MSEVFLFLFDTTFACQSSYIKVFASGDSFQDVCGELTGVIQGHPVHSPPFIPHLQWRAFWMSLITQEMEIMEKKSKNQQNIQCSR